MHAWLLKILIGLHCVPTMQTFESYPCPRLRNYDKAMYLFYHNNVFKKNDTCKHGNVQIAYMLLKQKNQILAVEFGLQRYLEELNLVFRRASSENMAASKFSVLNL